MFCLLFACLLLVLAKAWQRQAYSRLIGVVRSSPNKLHTVFDRAAKKADLGTARPECCCHQQCDRLENVGRVCEAEGHLAVVPVVITTRDGQVLRPHGGAVSSVWVRDPPPPPPCPPGPLSYQGSMATGHTYGGAEGARKFCPFFWGPPRMQGLGSISTLFWAPTFRCY